MMTWSQLLTAARYGESRPEVDDGGRSPFERDVSRLLFANAFRRLHNKTQVFPMPDNDHVHSRLTHSLEVADVGRTMGRQVGQVVADRHGLPATTADDCGAIVQAACLAHDIGNPPFGHAGEDAIGHFFTAVGPGAAWVAGLDADQTADIHHFEGNAQGFRILTRTSMYRDQGGMRLTAAVLGAFGKYPQGVAGRGDRSRVGGKKFGWFQADADAGAWVADTCGLLPVADAPGSWQRHPLAYLMEAADDVCYHVLDLEDGVMLNLVPAEQMAEVLAPIIDRPVADLRRWQPAALRGQAVGVLVKEVVAAFLDHEEAILSGTCRGSLTDLIPSAAVLKHIYDHVNMPCCYRSTVALDLEQTGYNVIGGLLENLCASAFGGRNDRLIQILPEGLPPEDRYQQILAITDYVSGMTDRYALRRYREWTGIAVRSV